MITNPIIPIWVMAIICVALLVFKRKGVIGFIRQIIIVVLLFMINLRIMIPGETIKVKEQTSNIGIMFVVDNTISMRAMDYNNTDATRMEGVKKDCRQIIEAFPNARIGAMSFNNNVSVVSPFTNNTEYVLDSIETLPDMKEMYARGSSLNIVIEPLKGFLENYNKTRKEKVYLFFLTDGEITDESTLNSFEEIKPYVCGGAVLGYGTKTGGKMLVRDFNDNLVELEDNSTYPYTPAISVIDENNLDKIASDLGIAYMNANSGVNLSSIISDIQSHEEMIEKEDGQEREMMDYADTYYWFAIGLAAMLLWEAVSILRKK